MGVSERVRVGCVVWVRGCGSVNMCAECMAQHRRQAHSQLRMDVVFWGIAPALLSDNKNPNWLPCMCWEGLQLQPAACASGSSEMCCC